MGIIDDLNIHKSNLLPLTEYDTVVPLMALRCPDFIVLGPWHPQPHPRQGWLSVCFERS